MHKAADVGVRSVVSRFFLLVVFSVLLSAAFAAFAAVPVDIEKRLQRIERLLDNQNLLQMYTVQQALKQELSRLRGDVDIINHELSQLKQQQKDIYVDLDQRIVELENKISSQQVVAGSEGIAPAVVEAEGSANTGSLSEQESYQAALSVLKGSQYETAIESFQFFLADYPNSDYAANAQYWMAEAYYVLKDYSSAVEHFRKVINAYPGSRKTADAYLKIGFSFYELKEWAKAKVELEKVLADYPASTAARLAQSRLQKMQLEKRI